jgi:hypothetical protein
MKLSDKLNKSEAFTTEKGSKIAEAEFTIWIEAQSKTDKELTTIMAEQQKSLWDIDDEPATNLAQLMLYALKTHNQKQEDHEEKSIEIALEYYSILSTQKPQMCIDPIKAARSEVSWWIHHDIVSELHTKADNTYIQDTNLTPQEEAFVLQGRFTEWTNLFRSIEKHLLALFPNEQYMELKSAVKYKSTALMLYEQIKTEANGIEREKLKDALKTELTRYYSLISTYVN